MSSLQSCQRVRFKQLYVSSLPNPIPVYPCLDSEFQHFSNEFIRVRSQFRSQLCAGAWMIIALWETCIVSLRSALIPLAVKTDMAMLLPAESNFAAINKAANGFIGS